MLDSKYHTNLHLNSEASIEVEVTSPSAGKTFRENNKGKKSTRKNLLAASCNDSPKSIGEAAKNAPAAFNFSRI